MIENKSQVIYLQNLIDRLAWIHVKHEGEELQILDAGVIPYYENQEKTLVNETPLEKLHVIIEKISDQISLGWFSQYDVVFIAPNHRLSARFLETPATAQENMNDLVMFEVSEALQIPIEKIAWDSYIAQGHGDSKEKHLCWIATRNEYIDGLLNAWPKNTLNPTQITSDFWAVYEYLQAAVPEKASQPNLFVIQEGTRATISVATEKAIYFTRSITLERPMRMASQENGDNQKARLLALEIERTLTYVGDHFPKGSLQSMILCGFENWDMTELEACAERNNLSSTQVTLDHLLHQFRVQGGSVEPEHLPILCMALCQFKANIHGPNLIQTEEAGPSWQEMIPMTSLPSKKFMTAAGGLVALLLLVMIGKSLWFHSALEERLAEGEVLLKLSAQLKTEEKCLQSLSQSNLNYGDLFIFLAEKLPQEILVKNINLDTKSGVNLVLVGGNHQRITTVIDELNQSPYFKNLTESRAANEQGGFTVYLQGELDIASKG